MSYFFKIGQKQVKIFNYHKTEACPVFIQKFFWNKKLLFRVADRTLRVSEQK